MDSKVEDNNAPGTNKLLAPDQHLKKFTKA